jgi:DNA-binding NarL/FixJ family response regulator
LPVRRVLVVDDYEPWRFRIRSELQRTPGWQVVGEAADGWEAIEQAHALAPDLILLDLELPTLTGVEAANRILAANPKSRILFVSAHQSWDIVQVAMATGARGYVLKSEAGHDLLPAMNAIMRGKRWLSSFLTGRDERRPPLHEIGVYSDEELLLASVTAFAVTAFRAGKSVIVAFAEFRRQQFERGLSEEGVDIALATREGRYVSLDPDAMLAQFMVDDWPDEDRFWKGVATLVIGSAMVAKGDPPRVAVTGDGAEVVLRNYGRDAAIRFEQMWDDVAHAYNIDVLCLYPVHAARHDDEFAEILEELYREHSAVAARL